MVIRHVPRVTEGSIRSILKPFSLQKTISGKIFAIFKRYGDFKLLLLVDAG